VSAAISPTGADLEERGRRGGWVGWCAGGVWVGPLRFCFFVCFVLCWGFILSPWFCLCLFLFFCFFSFFFFFLFFFFLFLSFFLLVCFFFFCCVIAFIVFRFYFFFPFLALLFSFFLRYVLGVVSAKPLWGTLLGMRGGQCPARWSAAESSWP